MRIQCDQESKWTCFSFKNCYRMQFKTVDSSRTNHFDVLTIFGSPKKFFWTEARYSKFSWFGLFTTWSDWDRPRANTIRIYKYAIWFLPLKPTKMPWIYCDFLDSPENDLRQNADNDLVNRCDKNAFNHHHYRLYHLSIWYSLPRRYLSTWPLSKFHVQTSHF